MNAGGKLATEELMTAYSQVAIDLKDSLAEVDAQLLAGLADANKVYADSMAEAEIVRQEKMAEALSNMTDAIAESKAKMDLAIAEAQKSLDKARTDAKKSLDKGLADAQKTLQDALIEAQKDYEKKVDEINKATKEKLADLQVKIKEVATAMSTLGASQAAYAAMQNAPVYGPVATGTAPTVSAGGQTFSGSTVTISQQFVTAKVSAAEMQSATAGALTYSQAVLTSSANKPATTPAAAVPVPKSAADIIAARRAAGGL
jgi:vacuolar-type H+-ATPase subunit H